MRNDDAIATDTDADADTDTDTDTDVEDGISAAGAQRPLEYRRTLQGGIRYPPVFMSAESTTAPLRLRKTMQLEIAYSLVQQLARDWIIADRQTPMFPPPTFSIPASITEHSSRRPRSVIELDRELVHVLRMARTLQQQIYVMMRAGANVPENAIRDAQMAVLHESF